MTVSAPTALADPAAALAAARALVPALAADVCADWLGAAALGDDPEAGGRW